MCRPRGHLKVSRLVKWLPCSWRQSSFIVPPKGGLLHFIAGNPPVLHWRIAGIVCPGRKPGEDTKWYSLSLSLSSLSLTFSFLLMTPRAPLHRKLSVKSTRTRKDIPSVNSSVADRSILPAQSPIPPYHPPSHVNLIAPQSTKPNPNSHVKV